MKYFLSLGSNINAEKNLEFALDELKKILSNIQSSSIHQTKAEGFEGDDFLNQAKSYAFELKEQSLSSIIETKAILKSFMLEELAKARSMETKAMKKLFGSEDNLKAVEKFFNK